MPAQLSSGERSDSSELPANHGPTKRSWAVKFRQPLRQAGARQVPLNDPLIGAALTSRTKRLWNGERGLQLSQEPEWEVIFDRTDAALSMR
jgi:hypothetical protein